MYLWRAIFVTFALTFYTKRIKNIKKLVIALGVGKIKKYKVHFVQGYMNLYLIAM